MTYHYWNFYGHNGELLVTAPYTDEEIREFKVLYPEVKWNWN